MTLGQNQKIRHWWSSLFVAVCMYYYITYSYPITLSIEVNYSERMIHVVQIAQT